MGSRHEKRTALVKAAILFLQADGAKPTRRAVEAFLRRNSRTAVRHDLVGKILADFHAQSRVAQTPLRLVKPGPKPRIGDQPLRNGNQEKPVVTGVCANRGPTRNETGTTTRASARGSQRNSLYIPPGAKAPDTPAHKPKKQEIPTVDLGPLEAAAGLFIANVAAENKSETMTPRRVATIRVELETLRLEHEPSLRYALSEANRLGKGGMGYLRAVIKSSRRRGGESEYPAWKTRQRVDTTAERLALLGLT